MRTGPNTKRRRCLLIVSLVATICCAHATLAQSGRPKKSSAPAPAPAPTPTSLSAEQKTPEAVAIRPPVRIKSVVVNGMTIIPEGYYRSNDVAITVEECIETLKERPVLVVIRGGMRDRKEAMNRARLEKDAYVLWLEINMKDRLMESPTVAFIDYFLFQPQTAAVVTKGRVDPANIIQTDDSGTRLPGRINKAPSTTTGKLRRGAREIANRVRRWF